MNRQRKKQIEHIEGLLSQARGLLEEVATSEREAYDNLPESFQNAERGERMNEAAISLEDAVDALEGLETVMEEAKG